MTGNGESEMTRCYLFDIDGTIADLSHRLHHIQSDPKNWPAFFAGCHADKPIQHILDLALMVSEHAEIIFVSGRSSECRHATQDWLRAHYLGASTPRLYMREAGDNRPDDQVKGELLDQILAEGYRPVMVFEDRNQVVKMWRARGIPCAQVAEGDF